MNRSYSLKRAEIGLVLEKGRLSHFPLFTLRTLTNSEVKSIKVAFVASKKVFPKAVLRNKAKRRSRDAFRQNLSNIKNGHYIFFLKKEVLKADFKDLKNAFIKI